MASSKASYSPVKKCRDRRRGLVSFLFRFPFLSLSLSVFLSFLARSRHRRRRRTTNTTNTTTTTTTTTTTKKTLAGKQRWRKCETTKILGLFRNSISVHRPSGLSYTAVHRASRARFLFNEHATSLRAAALSFTSRSIIRRDDFFLHTSTQGDSQSPPRVVGKSFKRGDNILFRGNFLTINFQSTIDAEFSF